MKDRQHTEVKIAAGTDKGVERGHNEDNFIICPNLSAGDWTIPPGKTITVGDKGCLLVVADGMGGLRAGEVASRLAIEHIQYYFEKHVHKLKPAETAIKRFLTKAIQYANQGIVTHSNAHTETKGMGTTIVLAWLIDTKAYIAWVGDSRAYQFHPDTGLRQVSKDHSLVQLLIDQGMITDEQAFFHPQRNIITQSLGEANSRIKPGFEVVTLREGDQILLCSDGLNTMLTDQQIEAILKTECERPTDAWKTLIDHANEAGGYDNITIALARIEKEAEQRPLPVFQRWKPLWYVLPLFFLLSAFVYYYNGSSAPAASPWFAKSSDPVYETELPPFIQSISTEWMHKMDNSTLVAEMRMAVQQLRADYLEDKHDLTICQQTETLYEMLLKFTDQQVELNRKNIKQIKHYTELCNTYMERACNEKQ